MYILRNPSHCPRALYGAVLVLGNLDGVHQGHQHLLHHAHTLANNAQCPWGVLTFEPHPAKFFQPHSSPFRLTPFRNKMEKLQQMGSDIAVVLHFTHDLATMSATAFVEKILCQALQVRHIIVGKDFTFGMHRQGDVNLLQSLAQNNDYQLSIIEDYCATTNQQRYSSTLIRAALRQGDIINTTAMLGHHWEITGRIRQGAKRGSTLLNCPTANIWLKDYLHPAYGVYLTEAQLEYDVWRPAITHIGVNQTFSGTEAVMETHFLDMTGDYYGKRLAVRLLDFMRPEIQFNSIDELKQHIEQDILHAKHYHSLRR